MAVAFVKSCFANNGVPSNPVGLSLSAAPSSGNRLIVCIGVDTNNPITGVTDNAGNTYTRDAVQNGAPSAEMWSAPLSSVPTTINVTYTATPGYYTASVLEFSGIVTKDASAVGTGSTQAMSTATTGTLGDAAEMAVGFFAQLGQSSGPTAGSGYTTGVSQGAALGNESSISEYRLLSSTAGVAATATGPAASAWSGVLATYSGVALGGGGGSGTTRQTGTATFTRSLRADGKVVETITGSGTWYAPPGVASVDVQAWGAGGASGSSTLAQGGGGGGGAYAGGTVTVSPSTPVTVTVAPSVSASATAGGASSFGSSVIAAGGTGGTASGLGTGAGGAGGTTAASTGTVKFAGGAGATGGAGGGSGGGGGAGGAASANTGGAAGITASGQSNPGAAGGAGGTTNAAAAPGGGAGAPAALGGQGSSGAGSVRIVYTETGNNNSVTTVTDTETFALDVTVTTIATQTDNEAFVDRGDNFTAATHTASAATSETQLQLIVSTITAGEEALAESTILNTIASLTANEAFAVAQLVNTIATITGSDALAEIQSLLSSTTLTRSEALAEIKSFLSSITGSGPWRLISSGLSGVAYDSAGVNVIPGVQVLVFEDPANTVVAQFVTDAAGYWFTQADPNKRYWISYWAGNLPPGDISGNLSWRTDRYIAPVDTVIDTGTSS